MDKIQCCGTGDRAGAASFSYILISSMCIFFEFYTFLSKVNGIGAKIIEMIKFSA
jgi:hypothetical protein